MRLWSLHPKYLDQKGLVAAWREGLLALAVLQGRTTGYRHHPQLIRFRRTGAPVRWMMLYLRHIHDESLVRGYHFDGTKISAVKPLKRGRSAGFLEVTTGQLAYELGHLRAKLATRDPARCRMLRNVSVPEPHPVMTAVPGGIEEWERTASAPGRLSRAKAARWCLLAAAI